AFKRFQPEASWAATELQEVLEAGVVQTVAGGAGELPWLAGLQHMGERVAEVAAVEFAGVAELGTVKGSAAEVELEGPAFGEAEGFFELAGGGVQQRRQGVLLNQCHRQVYAGVQFRLHPSHAFHPRIITKEIVTRASCGVAFQNTL